MSIILMVRFRKLYWLILIVTGISACGVDELSPCDNEPDMAGFLCKEYRFQNNTSIGYISYLYNKDGQVTRTDYNSTEGVLKKFITFEYENGKLKREASFEPDGDLLRETTYGYNNNNSLTDISNSENGVATTRKVFEYQNTFLTKESEFSNEQLDNYITYQYFNDDNKLYRKNYYNAQNNLINYTTHEYYYNNIRRYNHYSAAHEFLGYDVEHLNANGDILKFTEYNDLGEISSVIEYEYNTLGQLNKSTNYDGNEKALSHNLYLYY